MNPSVQTLAGTVTFLFTDIEGSTQLWEQHSPSMHAALARHDALLREAIESHHGQVFKTVGDAFYAVFPGPHEAVEAAVAALRALQQELPQIRVRMAVHTGEAEAREGDYFGPALNRVARLLAAGHGGQILLSRAAMEQIRARLPGETGLRSLGEHRLRDLPYREAIYQLVPPGLKSEFPPLNTLDVAFRRGLIRAAAVLGVVLAMVSGLALTAVREAHRAEHERAQAVAQARINRRERYDAEMNLAGQALEAGNLDQAQALIDRQQPGPGEDELRGFAWRYLRQACHGDERLTLAQSSDKINAVAISPNGRMLATGGDDKKVWLWDLPTRRRVAALPQGDQITAIAFTLDGQTVAAGSASGPVKLWNVAARREIRSFRRSGDGGLAFSPDGRILAAGSGHVEGLWDLATGRVIRDLPGDSRTAQATAVAFSPDGRRLAYAFFKDPTTVKLWDRKIRRVATLRGHTGFIFSVAFSPDGKTLATGSGDNTVRLWDVSTGQTVSVLKGLAGVVWAVTFSPDGKRLATGSGDGLVRLWDLERSDASGSEREVRLLKGHHGGVSSLAFTPDGKLLVSGSADHTVKLWNTVSPRDINLLRGHREWIWSVAFSPDGRKLASSGTHDGTVKLWDVTSGREIASRKITSGPGAAGVAADAVFSPDGRYLAFCGDPPAIQLWDAALTHEVGRFRGHTGNVGCVVFSPDGKLLASSSEDNTVRLWEVASRREIARFSAAAAADINGALLFSRDGKSLACIGGGTAQLWDVASHRRYALFQGCPITGGLAFGPDGRSVVTGGEDGALRWWDIGSGRVIDTVPSHVGRVLGLALSPDGTELAAVGDDSTARLWDPVGRQQILVLRGHDASLRAVAFSPDGNMLGTAGADRTVRLWRAVASRKRSLIAGTRAPRRWGL